LATYRSTKTFGHEVGLSCCFRQWKSKHSHCQYLHGYALSVSIDFEAEELDGKDWVVDFGDMGHVKDWLKDNFDHKTIVARDDPQIDSFYELEKRGIVQLNVIEHVGCEKFAEFIADSIVEWLGSQDGYRGRVKLARVKVSEHGANSAEWLA
tara:strand:- start:290 stop:745 length:456 start_codon:yes stop_codon:yes gene_type:complete